MPVWGRRRLDFKLEACCEFPFALSCGCGTVLTVAAVRQFPFPHLQVGFRDEDVHDMTQYGQSFQVSTHMSFTLTSTKHCRVSEPVSRSDKAAQPAASPGAREKLREALRRLAANDAFVDLLAAELSAVGLLRDGGGSALGTSV